MYVIHKIKSIWYLLRCAYVLMWRSLIIVLLSWIKQDRYRKMVNTITAAGAKRILKIIKADYAIEYVNPVSIDKNATYIFMSNHQSLFDIPLIYASFPGTIRMVTKAELFRIPLFGRALRAGECIPVERYDSSKTSSFIENAKTKLANGVSIWFFPEGTRSRDGALLPFKMGGFRLASETMTQIIPVGIVNTRAIMSAKKFDLSLHEKVYVRVGEPIKVESLTNFESYEKAMMRVRKVIENLIQVD